MRGPPEPICLLAPEALAFPSRRSSPTGPPLPGQGGAPHVRTTLTGEGRSGGLRCVTGTAPRAVCGHPRAARVQGRRARPPEAWIRVQGRRSWLPEAVFPVSSGPGPGGPAAGGGVGSRAMALAAGGNSPCAGSSVAADGPARRTGWRSPAGPVPSVRRRVLGFVVRTGRGAGGRRRERSGKAPRPRHHCERPLAAALKTYRKFSPIRPD